MKPKKYVTIGRAAKMCDCVPLTIRRALEAGELVAHRPGPDDESNRKRWRIDIDELRRWFGAPLVDLDGGEG